jgi:uncharacterized membrane protein YphA (DoxX/SURF4 family)
MTLQDSLHLPHHAHGAIVASSADVSVSADAETTEQRYGRYTLAVTRIALGFVFLWAFLDKTFGFDHATSGAKAWIRGGSPTTGFLKGVDGPFAGVFNWMAGSVVADWLFMIGLLGIGVALVLGIGMRLAAGSCSCGPHRYPSRPTRSSTTTSSTHSSSSPSPCCTWATPSASAGPGASCPSCAASASCADQHGLHLPVPSPTASPRPRAGAKTRPRGPQPCRSRLRRSASRAAYAATSVRRLMPILASTPRSRRRRATTDSTVPASPPLRCRAAPRAAHEYPDGGLSWPMTEGRTAANADGAGERRRQRERQPR